MKKFLTPIIVLSLMFLVGCGAQKPMTEAEQAAQYNMTVEEYAEEKQAAARMNMNFDEHIKMLKMEGMTK